MISRALLISQQNYVAAVSRRTFSAPFTASYSTVAQDNTCLDKDHSFPSSFSDNDYAVKVLRDGKTLSMNYGKKNENEMFQAAWLWANDPRFCHPSSGQKVKTWSQYDPKKANIMSAKIISNIDGVRFPPSPPRSFHSRGGIYQTSYKETKKENRLMVELTWRSGERSLFDLDWLSRFSQKESQKNAAFSRVSRNTAIGAIDNPDCVPIPSFDYQEIMAKENNKNNHLFQVLDKIIEHGAVLIKDAPHGADGSTVANLGRYICGAQLSHGSLYGDVFHVQSIPDARNIAYTTVELPPHQDLTYYESKPFLQLLHCVQSAPMTFDEKDRGESVLIDAMAAVEILRKLAPDLFQVLCEVEATFLKQREGADMVSAKPHIVTSPYDQSVIEVNWSPPFEGPLQYPLHLDHIEQEKFMDKYILAYQATECLFDVHCPPSSMLPIELETQLRDHARKFTWEQELDEGDIIIFNNQRMLHGRRSFSLAQGSIKQRHLIGCYTDAMDTIGHYKCLLRQQKENLETSMKHAGNGTRALFVN